MTKRKPIVPGPGERGARFRCDECSGQYCAIDPSNPTCSHHPMMRPKAEICPKGCRCGACYYGGFSGMKDWARHPDLDRLVGVRRSLEFPGGVVRAGTVSRVLRVEPAERGGVFILQLPDTEGPRGERGFDRDQLDFLTEDGRLP